MTKVIIILALSLVGSLTWGFVNYTEVAQLRIEIAEQREEADHWKSESAWQRERAFIYEDEIVRLEKELEDLNKLGNEIAYLEEGLQAAGEENDRLGRQVSSLSGSVEGWKTAYASLLIEYNTLIEQTNDPDYLELLLRLLL